MSFLALGRSAGTYANRQAVQLVILAIAGVLPVLLYFGTFQSMIRKWTEDGSYTHGFLIFPISLWLGWRLRGRLAELDAAPTVWGVVAAAFCALGWLIGRTSGVLVVEQLSAMALVPSLALAGLGWKLTRLLAFPLAFLMFAVPFGKGLVPGLMHVTADMATALLKASGVPVFRSHMYIAIPAGEFEVARACSGLNYFVTAFVLGALYAYLNFTSWRKRLICVIAFTIIPVVLNGLRVYLTILVSHLTDMEFGPGAEHVVFGKIFFIVMMVALFWIGRFWHDAPAIQSEKAVYESRPRRFAMEWWPLALACAVAAAGPVVAGAVYSSDKPHSVEDLSVRLPVVAGFLPPRQIDGLWRPSYRGALVEHTVQYGRIDSIPVDVFVAVYALGAKAGSEMINSANVIAERDRKSLAPERQFELEVWQGTTLPVREVRLRAGDDPRLVWYWFVIDGRPVASPYRAKAMRALAAIGRRSSTERMISVSAVGPDADARSALTAFVRAQGVCAVSGFSSESCGP